MREEPPEAAREAFARERGCERESHEHSGHADGVRGEDAERLPRAPGAERGTNEREEERQRAAEGGDGVGGAEDEHRREARLARNADRVWNPKGDPSARESDEPGEGEDDADREPGPGHG